MSNPQTATANDEQQIMDQRKRDQPSCSNVSLSSKFLFGLKGDVKNNVYYLDDTTVLYPCGHNICIYNFDEKS